MPAKGKMRMQQNLDITSLPKQVQEAAREVEALRAGMYRQEEEPGEAADQKDNGDTISTEAQNTQDASAEESTANEPVTPPMVGPGEPSGDEVAKWMAKYGTLKGKYDAEVPRMAEQIRELKAEIANMQRSGAIGAQPEWNQRQNNPSDQAQTPAATEINRQTLTEYDEEFGKVLDVVQSQSAIINELRAQIASLGGNVEAVQQSQVQTATDHFWGELGRLVPDFDVVNQDPEFIAWLDEEDGLSGRTRKESGNAALASMDHFRVARIVNEFKSSRRSAESANQPAAKKPAEPIVQPQPQSIQPSTAQSDATAAAAAVTQEPIFTSAEIDDIYSKRRVGRYPFQWRGQLVKTPADAEALCMEIQQAGVHGRIV